VDLNGPGGLFSFSFLADVVMTEKNTKRTKFEKNLTLLDCINLEVFLGIFVSIFNFFEFKFKSFESGRYVPVQTGTGDHRYHRYSRYTDRFAPVRRTLISTSHQQYGEDKNISLVYITARPDRSSIRWNTPREIS
jgi:hypothetical protein